MNTCNKRTSKMALFAFLFGISLVCFAEESKSDEKNNPVENSVCINGPETCKSGSTMMLSGLYAMKNAARYCDFSKAIAVDNSYVLCVRK